MLLTATDAGWDIETYAGWLKDTVTGLLISQSSPPATQL